MIESCRTKRGRRITVKNTFNDKDIHMRGIILLLCTIILCGCTTPTPYSWKDTREPAREEATLDLDECRSFAARQYRSGIPAGEAYLKDQADSNEGSSTNQRGGEWRPDRSPFPTTNINAQPVHDVPVDYTGYPGELDYSPSYLDDILEKCMLDRGWVYEAETGD
jgi:hypothetical protein